MYNIIIYVLNFQELNHIVIFLKYSAVWRSKKSVFGVSLWQESWYEFRVMAVMDDLISESSNVVGVSSTGLFLYKKSSTHINAWPLWGVELSLTFHFTHLSAPSDPFPPAELPEEGLARPVVAGVVATICFLAAAVLFSTLAACFVNKQHRRKLKRKPGQSPLSARFACDKHSRALTMDGLLNGPNRHRGTRAKNTRETQNNYKETQNNHKRHKTTMKRHKITLMDTKKLHKTQNYTKQETWKTTKRQKNNRRETKQLWRETQWPQRDKNCPEGTQNKQKGSPMWACCPFRHPVIS